MVPSTTSDLLLFVVYANSRRAYEFPCATGGCQRLPFISRSLGVTPCYTGSFFPAKGGGCPERVHMLVFQEWRLATAGAVGGDVRWPEFWWWGLDT